MIWYYPVNYLMCPHPAVFAQHFFPSRPPTSLFAISHFLRTDNVGNNGRSLAKIKIRLGAKSAILRHERSCKKIRETAAAFIQITWLRATLQITLHHVWLRAAFKVGPDAHFVVCLFWCVRDFSQICKLDHKLPRRRRPFMNSAHFSTHLSQTVSKLNANNNSKQSYLYLDTLFAIFLEMFVCRQILYWNATFCRLSWPQPPLQPEPTYRVLWSLWASNKSHIKLI